VTAKQPVVKKYIAELSTEEREARTKAKWQFTTENARIKLHQLYPAF
jgi:hypothetical protein